MQKANVISIIDIGSNSVRLRISANDNVLIRKSETTQLSRGIKNGFLSEESILRTLNALKSFISLSKEYGAKIYAFATAAVRNSKNGHSFCNEFKELFGFLPEVVSGKMEAQLGVLGALYGKESGAVIDIGGASSEVVIVKDGVIRYSYSMPYGAVTLTDACGKNKQKATNLLQRQLQNFPDISTFKDNMPTFYGIGGTANTLAFMGSGLKEYDRDKLNGSILTKEDLNKRVEELFKISETTLKDKYNISILRANVIHSGALIMQTLLDYLSISEILLTENDNLEGYYLLKIQGLGYEEQED